MPKRPRTAVPAILCTLKCPVAAVRHRATKQKSSRTRVRELFAMRKRRRLGVPERFSLQRRVIPAERPP